MGFRFRRSLKLMPGVRLNVGTKSASLSLGGRGSTINISSRGTRATYGLPGTGMSWTSSTSRRSGPTPRQLEAQARRDEKSRIQEEANAQVAAAESERQDLLNCWREMPVVPTREQYAQACIERPYEGPRPTLPDETQENQRFAREVETRLHKERKSGITTSWIVAILAFPCFFGLARSFLEENTPQSVTILIGLILAIGFAALGIHSWKRQTRILAAKAAGTQWPGHWRALQEGHQSATEKCASELASWSESERTRIAWTQKLISGDVDVLEEEVSSVLEGLNFPFETQCRVAIPNSTEAFILVDLPEIENVIPEVDQRALKNGTVKEVKRTKSDRNTDYLHLVAGIALLLARAAVTAGPTLLNVRIGAYTQRRQRGSGLIEDEFVYEASFDRPDVETWEPASVSPVQKIQSPRSRLDLRDNSELKRIHPPTWMQDMSEGS